MEAVATMDILTTLDTPLSLTENAAEQLGNILEQKGMKDTHGLRIFVKGGGCGGMQYGMTFDDNFGEEDLVHEEHGMKVVVDPTSLFYVKGSSIDYQDSLMGGGFHIENPNATSSCGCGSSFRTGDSHAEGEGSQGCGH